MDKRGFRVAFIDGKVLMWSKGKTIDDAVEIGIEEGGLYKLKGHAHSALDKRGFRVAFIDGKVLMWSNGKTLDDAVEIGVEE